MKAKQSPTPAPSYRAPNGQEKKIDPKDPKVDYLRGRLDQAKWESRQSRQTNFYGAYYHAPMPAVLYSDPFPHYFMAWLMVQSIDTRAAWCYHHHSVLAESGRYNDLVSKDAQLEARIRALEAQKVSRDPNYVPPGIPDPDLMYDDDFVAGVYNPNVPPPHPSSGPAITFWGFCKFVFWTLVIVGGLALVFYLIAVHRW